MRIILASRSPARRELMKELGVPFECHESGYREDMNLHFFPRKLATFLAFSKAEFIAHLFPDSFIIGADTFITIGGAKIGKPKSRRDALRIVSAMSGKRIKVYTGVVILKTDRFGRIEKSRKKSVITVLKIKKMSCEEIHSLVYHDQALQISGAFSIEGRGGKMVEKISGDYQNVIGLPMFAVRSMLRALKESLKIAYGDLLLNS